MVPRVRCTWPGKYVHGLRIHTEYSCSKLALGQDRMDRYEPLRTVSNRHCRDVPFFFLFFCRFGFTGLVGPVLAIGRACTCKPL